MFAYHTVTKQLLADLYTPVSAYMRLRDVYPQSVLMESSDYHSGENSRSFIGFQPLASVSVAHGKSCCRYPDGSQVVREVSAEYPVHQVINDFLHRFNITGDDRGFCGLYGFTSFNAVRYFEHIPVKDVTLERNDAPDLQYILYKTVVVFDHFNNTMKIIELLTDGESDHLEET
ncbi:MAG: anthranilate synthase component I family protein, partial [Paludibacteraceae bacterium]|nr:anthranilate synthase component I family protein [Paludibacteraceae bacterium]